MVVELDLSVWEWRQICVLNVWPSLENCHKHEYKVDFFATLQTWTLINNLYINLTSKDHPHVRK
jgi:hypothetical protein